jgi:hypothetical protein
LTVVNYWEVSVLWITQLPGETAKGAEKTHDLLPHQQRHQDPCYDNKATD